VDGVADLVVDGKIAVVHDADERRGLLMHTGNAGKDLADRLPHGIGATV